MTGPVRASPPAPGTRGGRSSIPALLAAPLLVLLAVPVILLICRTSPGAMAAELRSRETLQAILLSLATSTTSLLVSMALGIPLAYWLARSRSRLASIAETVIDLPTVLPPSVAGIALLLTFGRNGLVGSWLRSVSVELAFTTAAVVIAQVFVASPYFVRAARAGFVSIGTDIREAAVMDGAIGWQLVRRVLAPQAAPALLAGAAMCWSRAVGEFGATIIFAGNLPGRTQTMPLAVYVGLESDLDRALVLSSILIGLSVIVLALVRATGWRPAA